LGAPSSPGSFLASGEVRSGYTEGNTAIRELEAVQAWATRVLRRLQPE
jgi:hypothetical protein